MTDLRFKECVWMWWFWLLFFCVLHTVCPLDCLLNDIFFALRGVQCCVLIYILLIIMHITFLIACHILCLYIPDFLILLMQERWLLSVSCWVQDRPRKERGSRAVTQGIWGLCLCLISCISASKWFINKMQCPWLFKNILIIRLLQPLPTPIFHQHIQSVLDLLSTSLSFITRSWTLLKG